MRTRNCIAVIGLALFLSAGTLVAQTTYDLRNVGGVNYMTSVKNQNPLGTCWAFSAYGSFESNLLKQGFLNDPNIPYADLSEWHLANYANDVTQDYISPYESGWAGNVQSAIRYLAAGNGPVLEGLTDKTVYPRQAALNGENLSPYVPAKDLTNAWRLKEARNFQGQAAIKNAIQTHGAVSASMYWEDASYNSTNYTYYFNGAVGGTNHAITVAGWDDNKATSGGTGAWLVKNSWGTGWGDNGYMWISYNDTDAIKDATALVAAWARDYGKTYSLTDDPANYTYAIHNFATKYIAEEDTQLKAVSFFTDMDNLDYEITIYDDKTADGFSGLLNTTSGTTGEDGFYTIDLSSLVDLLSGDDFYIAISFLNTAGDALTTQILADDPAAQAGQCFFSMNDGASWFDGYDYSGSTLMCDIKGVMVPEPGTLSLLISGGLIVLIRRRHRRSKA